MTEDALLAAEHALRLLEGEELLAARRLASSDAAFAAEVAQWEAWFAPLYDDIADVPPRPDAWQRLVARLDGGSGATVTVLRRKLAIWRGAAVASAAAASILLALQIVPSADVAPRTQPAPTAVPAERMLVAALGGDELPAPVAVAFSPSANELTISASQLAVPQGRARELWLIPAGSNPVSLGLVSASDNQRRTVPDAIAIQIAQGATLALSDEPAGGSPTGLPTGAVLATGKMTST